MAKRVISIVLFFLWSPIFSQSKNDITVAFYNCENFFDTTNDPEKKDDEFLPESLKKWDQEKYHHKLQKVAQVLDSTVFGIHLPEMVGLAEIENKEVLQDLITKTQFKNKKYGAICTTGKDERSIDVGLIYDKSKFTLIHYEELDATNNTLDDYKTRNILLANLKSTNGDLIYVFVNHWPSRRFGELKSEIKRIYAAQVLRNKIDLVFKLNTNAKIIVMGDFNDYPDNSSILNILKANNQLNSTNNLYNAFYQLDKNKQGTVFYNNEWRCFDQIMLSQGFIKPKSGYFFNTKNAFILRKDFVMHKNKKTGKQTPNRTYGPKNKYYNGYSDHLCVYIRLDGK
jgi:endonuclease/exonuclease/phosphatase family metal-dependent hydrolase